MKIKNNNLFVPGLEAFRFFGFIFVSSPVCVFVVVSPEELPSRGSKKVVFIRAVRAIKYIFAVN